jgi:hypothetical protein
VATFGACQHCHVRGAPHAGRSADRALAPPTHLNGPSVLHVAHLATRTIPIVALDLDGNWRRPGSRSTRSARRWANCRPPCSHARKRKPSLPRSTASAPSHEHEQPSATRQHRYNDPASEPEAHDRGRSNQHSALLERQDCTLLAWYRSLYAPRTGGAYDGRHRTAEIAGCTRRRGSRVAARGARAAIRSSQTFALCNLAVRR